VKKILISLAMLQFVALASFPITQNGNMIINVASEHGQILPGASVKISSDVLMGTRTQISGVKGKAIFLDLPPGIYTIEVVMDGFDNCHKNKIEVRLGKTSKAEVTMKLGRVKEVVEIVDMDPIVDTTSNTVVHNFNFDNYINHIPIPSSRHYSGIAMFSAAVIGFNNPSAGGAGTYANLYMLDGVSEMDPRTHTWSGQFNIDSVSEITIINAGASAEYGHAIGMFLNIITKSGSNVISAIERLEMTRAFWNDISRSNPDSTADDTRKGNNKDAYYYSIGGPLYPDMLWWYFGYYPSASETVYNRFLDPMNPTIGTPAIRTYDGHYLNIKGTLQIGEDIKIAGFFREDPITINNANSYFNPYTQPSADTYQKQGGKGYMVSMTYFANQDLFLEAMWTRGRDLLKMGNQGTDPEGRFVPGGTTGPFFTSEDNWYWGVYSLDYDSHRNSDTIKGAANYILQSDAMGDHDIKFGAEYLDNWTSVQETYYPTNEMIFTSAVSSIGFDNVSWLERKTWENRLPKKEVHNKTVTVFLQDSMQLSDALTINAGLRTDIADLSDNHGTSILIDGILTALSPRLGFAYYFDKILLRGSVGRYYDVYSTYLIDDFAYFNTPETIRYYKPADGVDGRNGWTQIDVSYNGGPEIYNTMNPDLTPSYMDEATLGFDYLFSDVFVLSITGMYKEYKSLVSATDLDGDHYRYWTNINTPAYGSTYKRYFGTILELRKRPSLDSLFLDVSLTYQDLRGFSENVLTTSYYTNPYQTDERINNYWGDIGGFNWFAKAQVIYFFTNNWYIGLTADWMQGKAMSSSLNVLIPGWGNVTYYPNGRADIEKGASQLTMNIQVGIEQLIEIPIDISLWDDNIQIGIYTNVYNILNNQAATNIMTNLASSEYLKTTEWLNARSYQLGFRIEL
jgi:hypothetical protein